MNEQTKLEQQSIDYQRIEQAISYLQSNFRCQPSLDEIAASVHLSKYHFQRLFKRWAGVTPIQFLGFLTIEYAKRRLRESESVLEASLDAGLSGPGRLHDLFVSFDAITPGEFKRYGEGLTINYGAHATPFGDCLIAVTSRGICAMRFLENEDSAAEMELERLKRDWPGAAFVEDTHATRPYISRLFGDSAAAEKLSHRLLVKGTNFQIKVWKALLSIPPGHMVSYEDVANMIGRPGASRAVASAVSNNPIALVIPCHRVIRKSGEAQGYRWGDARKKAILGWEASQRIGYEQVGLAANPAA